jgi:hypothetical protein
MDPQLFLLSRDEVLRALGPGAALESSKEPGRAEAMGGLLAGAATASAFRSFSGRMEGNEDSVPIAVGSMVLLFARSQQADSTFERVGGAAHLRTQIGASNVAVETAAGANGLVSYWCYVQVGRAFLVLTLDTLDPQRASMTDFRRLVTAAADRLERRAAQLEAD